ncbi:MAG: LacI family DNA-binding transcriptional regulator [Deinococcus sp.]|nr:LacI family DNA-binding transcriptional regulator [Deinococcus sp.]
MNGLKRRVTIKDVAASAGVSYQTVSRVINDHPDVAPETRERVIEIIRNLDYRPSAIARSLVLERTRTLGLITQDLSDYFFTQVIVGAEREARKQGYVFVLGSTERNAQDEPAYLQLLLEHQIAGILFARPSTERDQRHIKAIVERGLPLVTSAYHAEDLDLTVVDVDNIDGGYWATRHLLEKEPAPVAMITGPAGWRSVNERTEGWRRAHAALGVKPGPVEQGDWSYESGYQTGRRLLKRAPKLKAVFAQNDRMAIAAIRAFRDAGRQVPQNIRVVGYDDVPEARYVHPSLTTMRQPMQEVGRIATQILVETINGKQPEHREVLLKTELIVRESSS